MCCSVHVLGLFRLRFGFPMEKLPDHFAHVRMAGLRQLLELALFQLRNEHN